MSSPPKVSVLIPTYNYAHYIDETISSVLNQTFQDFELIVIDDCSKDNTDDVMKKYESDKRISYFRNEKNLGLVGNWNECLKHATGDYIKILCADDKFEPQLLERFVDVMEQHSNVSLVTTFKRDYDTRELIKLRLSGLHSGKEIIYNTLNSMGWLGEPSAVMFRRANLKKTGNFKPNVIWLPDWEMWIRQLTVGDCYIIPEPLALVRNHAGQLTKKVMKGHINYFEEYDMCKAIKEHDGYNVDTSGIDMQEVVKLRAEKCSIAMYKSLFHITKPENLRVIKSGFKIALREKVLLSPILKLLSGKTGKNSKFTKEAVA